MFEKELYEVVKGAVNRDTIRLLHTEFKLVRSMMHFTHRVPDDSEQRLEHFNDDTVKKSFSMYSPMCFEALAQIMLPRIEKIVKKKLYQAFTYARFYYTGSSLEPHRDRPSCEYSITLCVANDEKYGPWPIFFQDLKQKQLGITLEPGDMIVYKGDVLPHWRKEYQGTEHCQAFMHYVDQKGPYKHLRYDERPVLGIPQGLKLK